MKRNMELQRFPSKRETFFYRFGLGVLLGLAQFLQIFLYLKYSAPIIWGSTSITLIITSILGLFFVFPAIASVQPGARMKQARVGLANGSVIGMVGALTLLIIVVIVLAIAVATAVPSPGSRIFIPPRLVAAVLFSIALFVSIAGIVFATLGGWLGGAIGKLWAKQAKGE